MKGYVVTLMNLPESVKMAERCISSGKKFGVEIEMFPAVWKTESMKERVKEGLEMSAFDQSWSRVDAVIGNFVSQYRIWKKIKESKEPGIVFEHDAIVVDSVPDLGKHDLVNLGKPSYGSYGTPGTRGIFPMFSKPGGYIPGAHGYYVTPVGAEQLINKAKESGAAPCDLYLCKKLFPNIMEIYPWVIEVDDEFSTIQKEKGCFAKHNYGGDYKIL